MWAKGAKIGPKTRFFFHFLKFSSLFFLKIAYNDSMQQLLTSGRCKIHRKNFGDQIWARNLLFCHFFEFGSLVFLEIAYNDSLQQFLTSSRGKIMRKKVLGNKFGPKRAKQLVKTRFFAVFSSLTH